MSTASAAIAAALSSPRVVIQPSITGITFTNSDQILSRDSRLAWLLWGASGQGKTYLAGQLDELTQRHLGKRTVYIPVEAGEGGGAATIRKLGVPMYIPKTYSELHKILGYLKNDKSVGGVVLDSSTEMYKQFIKPEALKYPCRENVATRTAGVPTRSDYQVLGELTSQMLRAFVALTTHENPEYRKHLIITAADSERQEDDKVNWIGPDLPGRMSREAVQMMQQVGTIKIKPQLIGGKRISTRQLTFTGNGVEALKDRYDVMPQEVQLAGPGIEGETLISIWEKYFIPAMVS